MAISQARISSALGALPSRYVGDWVQAIWQIPKTAVTRRNLSKTIVNAPVACDPPRLNRIVGPSDAEFVQRLIPIFRSIVSRGLNRAQLIRAARQEHTFFSVPGP